MNAPALAELTLTVVTPPDKTVTATSSSTMVALGTPEATGTKDSNPRFSNNAPSSTVTPAGAVGYWSFDDDLEDRSGGRNHAFAKGDAYIARGEIGGGALSLDGKEDYLEVKDNWNLRISDAFTLSAWINFDTLSPPSGSYIRILEKGTSPGEKYWMFYTKNSKEIGFGFISSDGDNQIRTKKTDWQVGIWYHIVGTYDPSISSNNMKIYVDGKLDNQVTKGGKPAVNYEPLMIGTKSTANGDFWQGQIDEIHVYRKALTATEVANLNKSPFVSLPAGTSVVTWKVIDSTGMSATAVQVVTVINKQITTPSTSLAINGVRYVDSGTETTFVTSGTHFDLSVQSSIEVQNTYYRFYKADDSLFRPSFNTGKYFQVKGGYDGEYITQFYSIDTNGVSEALKQKNVILDNSPPTTFLNVVSSTSDGSIKLMATDNNRGAGIGNKLVSGIYYKLDSATSYTFVQSNTVEIKNVANGAHVIYYYSVDNLGNTEEVKSAKFSGINFTFCSSGCDYNNLQTAINALPAGGGKIYIKDGKYTLSNTLTLKSGTILDFSAGSSIYFRGNSKPIFIGNGVRNIEIVGGDITAEKSGTKAFSFTDSNVIKVTGTKMTMVKGNDSNAFHCIDCTNVYISSVNAKSATRLIDIKTNSRTTDGHSSNIWIQNGVFDDSSIEGVKVNYSIDVHITGNAISNTAENGIDIGWSKNSEVRDNRLTRTGVPNGAAIHTDSANGADIIDNYIDTTGGNAIQVYRASNINVVGNTIINAGDQAISIITKSEPSSFIKVKSNHIIASTGFGTYQSPEQNQVEISFNIVENIDDGILPIYIAGSNPTTIEYGNTAK